MGGIFLARKKFMDYKGFLVLTDSFKYAIICSSRSWNKFARMVVPKQQPSKRAENKNKKQK
jgi:hypothetical protein